MMLNLFGETLTLTEFADLTGFSEKVIVRHLNAGMPPETLLVPRGKKMPWTSPSKIRRARELQAQGHNLRAISRETGLSLETVRKFVQKLSRSEGLKRYHARRKAEGRPILPPWQIKRDPHGVPER